MRRGLKFAFCQFVSHNSETTFLSIYLDFMTRLDEPLNGVPLARRSGRNAAISLSNQRTGFNSGSKVLHAVFWVVDRRVSRWMRTTPVNSRPSECDQWTSFAPPIGMNFVCPSHKKSVVWTFFSWARWKCCWCLKHVQLAGCLTHIKKKCLCLKHIRCWCLEHIEEIAAGVWNIWIMLMVSETYWRKIFD